MMDQSSVSVNSMISKNKPKEFQAGKISQHYEIWLKIISDKSLLNIGTNGYDIAFESGLCSRCLIDWLIDLILYVPSTIFQLYRDGSSLVEPVLS